MTVSPAIRAAKVGGRPEKSERIDFFVLWGATGNWHGKLTIDAGQFAHVTPYMFTDAADRVEHVDAHEVSWSSRTRGDVDGLQVVADVTPVSSVRFASDRTTQVLALKDLPATGYKVIHLDKPNDYLIFGKGSPVEGPHLKHQIPNLGLPAVPDPRKIPVLPTAIFGGNNSVRLQLSEVPAGRVRVRRRSRDDGVLYLEIYSPSGPLPGTAHIAALNSAFDISPINGSLWLSLDPRIGTLPMDIGTKANPNAEHLTVPTTLVEVRGTRLFVNGEPFLIKGTLPRGLDAKDARFIKTLGVNTLRGFNVEAADRYGFMLVASLNAGLGRFVPASKSPTEEIFEEKVDEYAERVASKARVAAQSPHTLVLQLGNEQADANDPWSPSMKPINVFDRLDHLLEKTWTAVKPIDPMLPLGYANHARGYIAPDFLDVYMHNSYMDKDRYGIPLTTFMKWQGCDHRPFINTEFGANRYTPQAYHGAKNSPVLEKIHAWNFPHRWKTYIDAGTVGAINYCLYDLGGPWDQGTSNFGLMTFDRKPKLACWDVWHMWRDFEVSPSTPPGSGATNGASLAISYRRGYWARNCSLKIITKQGEKTMKLANFGPHSRRAIKVSLPLDSFHWELDYTTHRGLPMVATGAWPKSLEEADFLRLLKTRSTYPFLKQLFDTQVVTVEGNVAPATLTDMQRPDGVVPVAFRKPDGTVYVTAFARLPVRNDLYVKADIQTAFRGKLVQVDEWTGKPIPMTVEWDNNARGIRIRKINVPRIPGPIGQRSDKPLSLPVFRITQPSGMTQQ